MSQNLPIRENYLVVLFVLESILESILESVLESTLKYILKSIMLIKYLKNHSLPKFAPGPPLGGRPDKKLWRP